MQSIAEEIHSTAEDANKCINYPIGDKLTRFIKLQNDEQTNFVLSGVLIFAASRIFSRKVDYLEQEILGIARNFENVESSVNPDKEKVEAKKSRTKKYNIEDSVNITKLEFEEKEFNVLPKTDINKTLAMPSKISRLQKLKEFFAKNKTRNGNGKIIIPKSFLLSNDYSVSIFGGTQIHDYDDYKDIVGSRRDFTSFSYHIDLITGELQKDKRFTKENLQYDAPEAYETIENDFCNETSIFSANCENRESFGPTRSTTPDFIRRSPLDMSPLSPSDINIDEGISIEPSERQKMLLSPVMTERIELDDTMDISACPEQKTVPDVNLKEKTKKELNKVKFVNIFLIPLKRLKHKCAFNLPDDEFRELKRRKIEQCKSTVDNNSKKRLLKMFDLGQNESPPNAKEGFRGFTREQQLEDPRYFDYRSHQSLTNNSYDDDNSELETLQSDDMIASSGNRKFSSDSGIEAELNRSETSSPIRTSQDDGVINSSSIYDHKKNDSQVNITEADSCYNSLASGESIRADISSFFREPDNSTTFENETITETDESRMSADAIMEMRKSAIKVAKWKDLLKPILAQSESRSIIDIHKYGTDVINKIGNIDETVTFDKIIEPGKMPAYFLTMLTLINNRNITMDPGERTMDAPTDIRNIKLTLKSKTLHKDKFSEMGEHFAAEDQKQTNLLKRKALQTSTPAKRQSLISNNSSLTLNSLTLNSLNLSQDSVLQYSGQEFASSFQMSQGSSGYCSQNSTFSEETSKQKSLFNNTSTNISV